MAHQSILPEGWPRPKGYSNGVLAQPGRLLCIAGQVGWDEQERMQRGFLAQWEQALVNLAAVLREAGGQPEDLVRVTVFVTDCEAYRRDLAAVGEAWRRHLGRIWPAMTLVQVAALLEEGAEVEVEATAVLS